VKVVLITGASSGIGWATSHALCRDGYHVVGTARREDRLDQLRTEIDALSQPHGDFVPVAADVRDPDSTGEAVQRVLDAFGHLDVVIANAGLGHRGGVIEADWEDAETLLRTNIDGVLHTIRAAVPVMKAGGQVILISSVAYNTLSPYAALYAASKAFVSSLAGSLRLELEDRDIAVTEMLVGRVATDFSANRLGKSGRAGSFPPAMPVEQVAAAISGVIKSPRQRVALRWIDRLIMVANLFFPGTIGRRALKQYR
jgi:short-subunit dehydrogenase